MPSIPKSLLHASVLVLLTAAAGAHAGALPSEQSPTRRVSYADLDLTRDAGAAALYSRIQSAARAVCAPAAEWEPKLAHAGNKCAAAALARAVSDVDEPLLTTFYRQRNPGGTAR